MKNSINKLLDKYNDSVLAFLLTGLLWSISLRSNKIIIITAIVDVLAIAALNI